MKAYLLVRSAPPLFHPPRIGIWRAHVCPRRTPRRLLTVRMCAPGIAVPELTPPWRPVRVLENNAQLALPPHPHCRSGLALPHPRLIRTPSTSSTRGAGADGEGCEAQGAEAGGDGRRRARALRALNLKRPLRLGEQRRERLRGRGRTHWGGHGHGAGRGRWHSDVLWHGGNGGHQTRHHGVHGHRPRPTPQPEIRFQVKCRGGASTGLLDIIRSGCSDGRARWKG